MKKFPNTLPFIELACTLLGIFYFIIDVNLHPFIKILVIIAICSVAYLLLIIPTDNHKSFLVKKRNILLIVLSCIAGISVIVVIFTWNHFKVVSAVEAATNPASATESVETPAISGIQTPSATSLTPIPTTPTATPLEPTPTPTIMATETPTAIPSTPAPTPSPVFSQETIDTFDIGYLNYVRNDFGDAFPLLMKAAKAGYPKAQLYVGFCYQEGKGVVENSFKAFEWFCLSAEQGLDIAQYNVGYSYHTGYGVHSDDALAFEWFKKAADQNNELGLLWTGYCYHYGKGVQKDYDLAEKYYTAAIALGNSAARDRLSQLQRDRG